MKTAHTLAAALLAAAAVAVPQRALAIDFDYPDAPPATVEIDLTDGLLGDLFGLSEAAVVGVADSIVHFAENGGEESRFVAENADAVRRVVSLVSESVSDLRLRVYEDLPAGAAARMFDHYTAQGASDGWRTAIRVREDDQQARVSLRKEGEAIAGAFVVAGDGSDFVIAEVGCDLSPDRVREIASTITTTAIELGLGEKLEQAARELREEMGR